MTARSVTGQPADPPRTATAVVPVPVPVPTMALIGRETETERILRAVDAGRNAPQGFVLLGEAGAGKTALLDFAAEHARRIGTRVLAYQGSGGRTEQSFAALRRLLCPLLPEIAELPEHLRAALEAAFGLSVGAGAGASAANADTMHLRIAVLTLLAGVSRRQPILVAVDDLHLFDRESHDVLGFALRRLATEPVTRLFAAGGSALPEGFVSGLPILALGPLSRPASVRLMDVQPRPPVGRARIEVLEQAEGNPLAIIELCRAAGEYPPDWPSHGGRSGYSEVQERFAARLGALPETSRRLVLYAAASMADSDLATVMAATGAGSDLAAWAPAEAAGLVAIADGRVRFGHPLVRIAAYHRSTGPDRRRAHGDLAAALAHDPVRRAWQAAAASLGPAEQVAAELEETAELAGRRGGMSAAARVWERAAECSPDPGDRARRYAEALRSAVVAGDPSWAVELNAEVRSLTRNRDLLGAAAWGTARALSSLGRQREAFQTAMAATDPPPADPSPAAGATMLALVAVLAEIGMQSGLPEIRRPVAALLDRLDRLDRLDQMVIEDGHAFSTPLIPGEAAAAIRAGVLAGIDPVGNAPVLLSRTRQPSLLDSLPGASSGAGAGEAERLQVLANVAFWSDEPDLCLDAVRKSMARFRAAGAMGDAAQSFPVLAATLIDTGRWSEADEVLAEAGEMATVQKLVLLDITVQALRAMLRALRGSELSEPSFELPWTAVDLGENRAAHAQLARAAAARAMAAGDFDDAYRHLRQLFDDDGAPLHYFHAARSIADLALAASRIGREQEAAIVVAAVRESASPQPTTRMTLLLHHAEALVGDARQAEQHFRLAVVNPAAEQWPLARAQARLHYAQWLRRRRRPAEARALATAALESFSRLGAEGLADQARAELRASGVATAPATPDPLSTLTAQERKIVRLAGQGLSNREIAERLVLSPRTIGAHLHRAYPKLGVTSRHQLRDFVDDL